MSPLPFSNPKGLVSVGIRTLHLSTLVLLLMRSTNKVESCRVYVHPVFLSIEIISNLGSFYENFDRALHVLYYRILSSVGESEAEATRQYSGSMRRALVLLTPSLVLEIG